jgi:hypothetical protein
MGDMAKPTSIEWISEMLHASARAGFQRAYEQVRIDPEKYLHRARRKYRLPIREWRDVHVLDESVIAPAAEHIVLSSSRTAALEGAGFGFSGILGTVPDMGILAAITVRMLQKLSLIHGFEYSTGEEMAGLWLAAASAAGLDFGREFVEKQAAEKLVPKVIDQVACKMGAEFAEKWVGRLVPMVSAGIAGTLNYYFIRAWGRRARRHFLDKHRGIPRLPFLVPVVTAPRYPA